MKKVDLLKLLAQYDDSQEILVEGFVAGFDEPTLYVTSVRPCIAAELSSAAACEFVQCDGGGGAWVLVLGTSAGAIRLG